MPSTNYEWVYDFNICAEVLDQRISSAEVDDLNLVEATLDDISFNDSLAAYTDCGS